MEKILAFSTNIQKILHSNQNSLFGDDIGLKQIKLELETVIPADKKQVLSWERELLGLYISEHPLSDIGHVIDDNRTIKLSEITQEKEGNFVRIAGVVTSIQKIITRNNQNMLFAKIEDLQTNAEILVFPKVLEKTSDIFKNDKILAVDGFISFKDGALKILADNAYEISTSISAPLFMQREKRRKYTNVSPKTADKVSHLEKNTSVYIKDNIGWFVYWFYGLEFSSGKDIYGRLREYVSRFHIRSITINFWRKVGDSFPCPRLSYHRWHSSFSRPDN
jgi:DNA polymerase-3 subunit alpha